MTRRAFIAVLAGVTAWPPAARAQQPAMQVIGLLSGQSPEGFIEPLRGFRQGLKESGFIEGENVAIEYRWAENMSDRLPTMAAELVRRRVAVITAFGSPSVLAVKLATTTTPIVFNVGEDPVRLGLASSLARPGGNLTGINFFATELAAKRLALLRELLPKVTRIGVLVNPANAAVTEAILRDVEAAARSMGLQTQILFADTSREIDAAFAALARERAEALFVGGGAFFTARRVQLAQRAARHAMPTIYPQRQNTEVGGLLSYGASVTDAWRHVGVYAGRILKGTKPADLPVAQASTFELVINADTARMLGLTVPPSLLAIADEVIE